MSKKIELAIYFPDLHRLEMIDDFLKIIDAREIPSYLATVMFSLNPNNYEFTNNLSSLSWLQLFQDNGMDFSRLYFGQEFCQNLTPPAEEVEHAYYFSRQMDWDFTYVTGGYQTDVGISKIVENLTRLRELGADDCEVVVNDWGVLNVIHRDFPELKGRLVLGRLLNKQTRMNLFAQPGVNFPVHMNGIETVEQEIRDMQVQSYRDVSLSNPVYLKEVHEWGFTNVDFDMTPQGIYLPEGGWDMTMGLYYPWSFIATARNCPTAGLADPVRTFVMTDKPCGKMCKKYNCTPLLIQFETPAVQRGPTLFTYVGDFAEHYFLHSPYYERLIFEPCLPI